MEDKIDLLDMWQDLWSSTLLRGAIALLFGLTLILSPSVNYLPWYVLGFMFATGLAMIIGIFLNGRINGGTNTMYLQGGFSLIASILVGLFSYRLSNFNRELLLLFAIFLLVNGVLDLVTSFAFRNRGGGFFFITLNGIVTGFLGLVLLVNYLQQDSVTLRANDEVIGYVSIASGVMLTLAAFSMSLVRRRLKIDVLSETV